MVDLFLPYDSLFPFQGSCPDSHEHGLLVIRDVVHCPLLVPLLGFGQHFDSLTVFKSGLSTYIPVLMTQLISLIWLD